MNIELEGYEFIHVDNESNTDRVGLYISNNPDLEILNDVAIDLNSIEGLWEKIKRYDQTIVIGVICRHPVVSSNAIFQFKNKMFSIFE